MRRRKQKFETLAESIKNALFGALKYPGVLCGATSQHICFSIGISIGLTPLLVLIESRFEGANTFPHEYKNKEMFISFLDSTHFECVLQRTIKIQLVSYLSGSSTASSGDPC